MKHILHVFTRRQLLRAAAVFALVGLALCLGAVRRGLTDRPDQQAADRWMGDDTRYAQVSLFLSKANALTLEELNAKRSQLDAKLTQASHAPAGENARVWVDAASAETELAATTGRGSANVRALAVCGDYFIFHPVQLLSGSTFRQSDTLHDTLVLDELAAWQLFGSYDVVGRVVEMGGKNYTVCGVVAMPEADDSAAALTYGDRPRVWLFYDYLYPTEASGKLTYYEVLLPNAYTGYARALVEEVFSTEALDCAVVENSTRYGFGGLWQTLRQITRSAMRTQEVAYPWWENAAAYTQTRAALLFGGQVLCMLYPALALLAGAVWCWRHRPWRLKDLFALLERRRQKKLQAAWDEQAHIDAFH